MKVSQRGFSMIELVSVMTIVGILAAVAIPAYQEYAVRARVVEALGWIAKVRYQVALIIDATGFPPANNVAAGLDPVSTNNTSPYVASVSVSDGKITVGFQNTGNTTMDAGSLELSPDTAAGNVRWICRGDSTALNRYLPANCREPSGS